MGRPKEPRTCRLATQVHAVSGLRSYHRARLDIAAVSTALNRIDQILPLWVQCWTESCDHIKWIVWSTPYTTINPHILQQHKSSSFTYSCSSSRVHRSLLGDKVSSGIGLWYRPARLHGLAGRYHNHMPDFIPQSGIYEFGFRPIPQYFRSKSLHSNLNYLTRNMVYGSWL